MANITRGMLDEENDRFEHEVSRAKYSAFDVHSNPEEILTKTKIMLNGNWIGTTDQPLDVVGWLRRVRVLGEIPFEVSIVRDISQKEIKIYTDSGRCMRPLIVVGPDNQIKMKKSNLVNGFTFEMLRRKGFVEFLDVE
jgi:DNA-directed RNA polymerase II subunit RPB2